MPRKSSALGSLRRPMLRRCSAGASSSAALAGLTLPPYWMRTARQRRIVAGLRSICEGPDAPLRPAPAWPLCRCRWPRPARRRSRPSAICSADNAGQRAVELLADHVAGLARLALGQQFADADDRHQPGGQRGMHLFVDRLRRSRPSMCRRSLWPRMTYRQPRSTSMAALISPVNAPLARGTCSGAQADRAMPPIAARRRPDRRTAGKRPDRRARYSTAAAARLRRPSATAPARSRFIFQLPAINGRLMRGLPGKRVEVLQVVCNWHATD